MVVAVAGSAALLRRQERSFPHCSRQGALTHDHLVVGMGSAHAFSTVEGPKTLRGVLLPRL